MLTKKVFSWCMVFVTMQLLITSCSSRKKEAVEAQFIALQSLKDIRSIDDSLVVPYLYINPISLHSLTIKEKKKKFIDMILPAILIAKFNIDQDGKYIRELEEKSKSGLGDQDSVSLVNLLKKYGARDFIDLKVRSKTHPVSVVLAQAAIESGWGTSEFYLNANNVFGVWANDNTEEKVMARTLRAGKPIYVKRYSTISSSIEDYFLVLAKVRVYKKFRKKRFETNEAYALLPFLNSYSELGKVYTRRLRRIIRENNLTKYDHYKIDRKFIIDVEH